MYFCVGIFIFICILFSCLCFYRKSCAIRKVNALCTDEKCRLLSHLIEPAGYTYDMRQDIFTSLIDAWQRDYGYCAFFDRTAPFFQMVFDCEPIYFDYCGKTWMIEIWKGQYGINSGCEVGIYRADTLISPSMRKHTLFHAVTDEEMLPISVSFFKNQQCLFEISKRHWWLAGFCLGLFSRPYELHMTVSITFPNCEMMCAFSEALRRIGYSSQDLCLNGLTASFCFALPKTPQPGRCFFFRRAVSQWKNRLFCRIYCRMTRPFCTSIDRLLYLYYFLPFAFRRMVTIRKPRRKRRKRA